MKNERYRLKIYGNADYTEDESFRELSTKVKTHK